MIKNTLLLAALASLVSFSACKKEEKKEAETAAKTTEAPAADKAADTAPTADKAEATKTETAPAAEGEKPAEEAAAEGEKPAEGETAGALNGMTREVVAEKGVALFTKLGENVKAANGDCAKIATSINDALSEGKDVIAAGKELSKNEENDKWFKETHGETMKKVMGEMLGAISPCMENADVQKALAALNS